MVNWVVWWWNYRYALKQEVRERFLERFRSVGIDVVELAQLPPGTIQLLPRQPVIPKDPEIRSMNELWTWSETKRKSK